MKRKNTFPIRFLHRGVFLKRGVSNLDRLVNVSSRSEVKVEEFSFKLLQADVLKVVLERDATGHVISFLLFCIPESDQVSGIRY